MSEEKRINIFAEEPAAAAARAEQTAQAPKIVYASVPERFVALMIDYGVIFLPAQLVFWILGRFVSLDVAGLVWLAVSVNVIFILYEAVFSCGGRATLGKHLVGIAVVNKDVTDSVGFFRALLRAVGYYISAALFMCGFLLAFFDDRRRALHDFLGGSVVIETRPKGRLESVGIKAAGTLLMLAFAGMIYAQVFGKGSLVQQYYVQQAQDHLSKVALLEEVHYAMYGYYTNDLLRLSLLSGDPVQFQRDTQKVLYNKGFRVGVKDNRYLISARAKDVKHTPVYYVPPVKK